MASEDQDLISMVLKLTENTEAPVEYREWAGVMAIASAIGRRAWVNMGHFTILPNHYCILVASPAIATKSTMVGIARNLATQAGFANNLVSFTYQALLDSLVENTESIKFPDGKRSSLSEISLFIGELGTMLQTRDTDATDMLINLWDGAPTDRRTRGGGHVELTNPCVNIFGGTTPSWLREQLTSNLKEGGFLSRTALIWGSQKARLIPWPDELVKSEDTEALQSQIIKRLKQIRKLRGQFTVSEDAREFERIKYQEDYRKFLTQGESVLGYESRRQVHTIKLAMVLSLSRGEDLVISLEDYHRAFSMVQKVIKDIRSILGTVEEHENIKNVDRVWEVIPKQFRVQSSIYAKVQRNLSLREFKQALHDLEAAGHVEKRGQSNPQWRRKK